MSLINEARAEELGAELEGPVQVKNSATIATTETAVPAKAPQPSMEQSLMSFLPLVIIFVVFYFFLIRPQSKKHKEQQKMVENLKKGDKIVMSNGIAGTIIKMEDNKEFAQVEIAPDIKIRVLKSAVMQLMTDNSLANTEKPLKNIKSEKIVDKVVDKIEENQN